MSIKPGLTATVPSTVTSHAELHSALSIGDGWRASVLYRLLLIGPTPKGVQTDIPEVWPGDPAAGVALLDGHFTHGGETHVLANARELPDEATAGWRAWFHGHGWLKDLRAVSNSEAPYFAREWLSAWMDAHRRWSPIAWAPEVAAERLVNWCQHWPFLIREDKSGPFEMTLRKTAGRTARHIFRTLPPPEAGFKRLHTLKGQAFAAFALLGSERHKAQSLQRLEDAIAAQVLPDGGHVERNPERLVHVLCDLLELKALFSTVTGDVPGAVQNAIDRSAPMIRALRHPDGGLALFNGGQEQDPAWLDLVLAQTDSTAKPPQAAPHAGFQRLAAGAVHVLVDTGKPTPIGTDQHGGTLSFEMSSAKHRIVVNCGAHPSRHSPWRTALAATAAHSCLTVDDTSSATFALDGTLRTGPNVVRAERQDVDAGTLLETQHDGYQTAFALTHHRALYLAAHGTDLRGEDRLVGTGGNQFTIRFHLHPSVQASLLSDGHGVLLRLPNKEVWRFRTSNDGVRLEESVYLPQPGVLRRSEQIVVTGPLSGNGALVKWAFSREGA